MWLMRFFARIPLIGELINAAIILIPALILTAIYIAGALFTWSRVLAVDFQDLYPAVARDGSLGQSLFFHATLCSFIAALGAFYYLLSDIFEDNADVPFRVIGIPVRAFGFVIGVVGLAFIAWPYVSLDHFQATLPGWPLLDLLLGKG